MPHSTITTVSTFQQTANTGANINGTDDRHDPPNPDPNPNTYLGPVPIPAPRCQHCRAALAVFRGRYSDLGPQAYCNNSPCLCTNPSDGQNAGCRCLVGYHSASLVSSSSVNGSVTHGYPPGYSFTPNNLAIIESLLTPPAGGGLSTQAEMERDTSYAGTQFPGFTPANTPSPDILTEDALGIRHPALHSPRSSRRGRRRGHDDSRSEHCRSSRR